MPFVLPTSARRPDVSLAATARVLPGCHEPELFVRQDPSAHRGALVQDCLRGEHVEVVDV